MTSGHTLNFFYIVIFTTISYRDCNKIYVDNDDNDRNKRDGSGERNESETKLALNSKA